MPDAASPAPEGQEPDWKIVAQIVMQQRESATTQLYDTQIKLILSHNRVTELEQMLQTLQPKAAGADSMFDNGA